jgi:hypothetical protein
MASSLSRRLRDPLFLLCLTAGLLGFVVQSGELGTADTMHRLQTTHAIWTSEPQVFPNEYPEFGLHGRDGKLYSWYGMGQSLLMLPADIVGTGIARLPIFSGYGDDPAVRSIVVSYSTNILISVLTALICFRFLGQLGFHTKEVVAGALALMFCTTHLHYTQNLMENNYILLLTLAGFSFQYEWLRTGGKRALVIGSFALGLNLLTRLTTGLDLVAAGIFLLLVLWFEKARGQEVWRRFVSYCKVAGPVYAGFVLIDRVYQFYRFGSFTNTYVTIFAQEYHRLDPTLPANFPWSSPFHVGVIGALFTAEKSIFLFDPLLVLAILLAGLLWKGLSPTIRGYVGATFFLLVAYICFYARYTYWSGDFAWGDRYVSTSVELAALIAVPLLLRVRSAGIPRGLKPTSMEPADGTAEAVPFPKQLSDGTTEAVPFPNYSADSTTEAVPFPKHWVGVPSVAPSLGNWIWRVGVALIAVSFVIQLASLAFWLPLEIYQMETLGHPTFVIALRFKNIVAFGLGKMDAWGLKNDSMTEDAWDYVHISTWNFLPFLLRRVGTAPRWVVDLAFTVWGTGIAALSLLVARFWHVVEW